MTPPRMPGVQAAGAGSADEVNRYAKTNSATQRQRYGYLGIYRFLLAFFVFVGHINEFMQFNLLDLLFLQRIGVALFFVVSGYVIFSAYQGFYQGKVVNFAVNRFLRIYPTYWAAYFIALALVVISGALWTKVSSYGIDMILGDLTLLGSYFRGSGVAPMTPAWTLVVEVQFYFIAFLLFLISERYLPRRVVMVGASVLALVVFAYVEWTGSFNRWFGGMQYAPLFIIGAAIYGAKNAERVSIFQIIGLCVLVVASSVSFHGYVMTAVDSTAAPIVVFLAFLSIFVVGTYGGLGFLSKKADKFIGDLTYPLYLTHFPVIVTMRQFGEMGEVARIATVFVVTTVLTLAVYFLVDTPMARIRARVRGVQV